MHHDRICDLGEDLRNHVFNFLDDEPECDGMTAGKIAAAVEEAFLKATHAEFTEERVTYQSETCLNAQILGRGVRTKNAWCIKLYEQTHAECQGHACDDHIHIQSMNIPKSDLDAEILQTVEKYKKEYEEALEFACKEWRKNNPEETEFSYEGEEFLGMKWVEIEEVYDNRPSEDPKTALEEIIGHMSC